jgi:hypothetical protein
VTSSTFSGSSASFGGDGGGIDNAGTLVVTSSTFSGNTAIIGGGIFNLGMLTVTSSTFSGNTAIFGGGISNGGTLTLNNSIVANSTHGDVSNHGTVSGSHNLIEDASDGLSDTITSDPLLAPLGNYGGPTQTFALLPGSPAIDAGPSTGAPTTDQRGQSRVGNLDLGAFESQGFVISVSSGNNQSATVNTAFASPLLVQVTANSSAEPVDGGLVTFTAPSSGASATLSGTPATISSGLASVTATANATAASYQIVASAKGASSASFTLTNVAATATISGVAFRDNITTDGVYQPAEATLSGWTILLYQESNGQAGLQTGTGGDTLLAAQVTGSGGSYSFGSLTVGATYHVREVVQSGWTQTSGNADYLPLTANQTDNLGNIQLRKTGTAQNNGYWANHGSSSITQSDINTLNTFSLRNADGSRYTITGNSLATEQQNLASFLSGASAANMANLLSAQLIALKLNVLHGLVPASQYLDVSTIQLSSSLSGLATYYSCGGHAYVQIADLLSGVANELSQHPTAYGGDAWRPFQEALKNVLDALGNDRSIYVF